MKAVGYKLEGTSKRKSHLIFLGRTIHSCKMKGWTVSFLSLPCMLSCVLAIFDDHQCQPGQFKVISKNAESFIRCQTCYMCPPGYGVQKECSETADTLCRRCPEGSFSDSSTRRGGCKQCTPCMDEHDTLQECTANSDRVCRNPCDTGKFLNVEHRRCESCSFCHENVNVNVSKNAQCENQGLPPMWTCWPNITVTTDNEETEIVVDTGETYSYITATEKSKGGHYSGSLVPPLKNFLLNYMSTEAPTTVPKKKTTPRFGNDDIHSSVIVPIDEGHYSATTMFRRSASSTTASVSSKNESYSPEDQLPGDHVAIYGENKYRMGSVILQVISYTLVFVLTVTVIIQRLKIKSLSGKKPMGINRQISHEQGIPRNQAWREEPLNQEDENASEELLENRQTRVTGL